MIDRTTQPLFLTRALVLVAGVFCLALATGTAARAAPPSQFEFTHTDTLTDTTSCSFPIEFTYTVRIRGRSYFDNAGNFLGMDLHHNLIGTDSANGITLKEADNWSDHIDSSGALKGTGVELSIRMQAGGGGVVIHDAGVGSFNPDGSIAYVRGQHPFLTGDTAALCAALS
jgi:hypothetical protein